MDPAGHLVGADLWAPFALLLDGESCQGARLCRWGAGPGGSLSSPAPHLCSPVFLACRLALPPPSDLSPRCPPSISKVAEPQRQQQASWVGWNGAPWIPRTPSSPPTPLSNLEMTNESAPPRGGTAICPGFRGSSFSCEEMLQVT